MESLFVPIENHQDKLMGILDNIERTALEKYINERYPISDKEFEISLEQGRREAEVARPSLAPSSHVPSYYFK